MYRNILTVVLVTYLLWGASLLLAQQKDPGTLPARDTHEGLLVAADPWTDAALYKARFKKMPPNEKGILAIDVYFRNDTDKLVRIDLDTIRLLVALPDGSRQKLTPLKVEEVADQVLDPAGNKDPTTARTRIPIPRGPKKSRDKKWQELADSLRAASLPSDIVGPRKMSHGLLYFDAAGRFDLLPEAKLYIPDLKFVGSDKPLFYFEIELGRANRQ